MKNKLISHAISTSRIILISSLTIFTLYTVQAWVSPTLSAPNGNVGGPLTTATSTQIKTGSLGLLDSLSIGKDLIVNGTTTTNVLRILTGAGANKVLTSDASGNASWQTVAGGVTSLVAGTNITLSPVSGVGAVTVNAARGGNNGGYTHTVACTTQCCAGVTRTSINPITGTAGCPVGSYAQISASSMVSCVGVVSYYVCQ